MAKYTKKWGPFLYGFALTALTAVAALPCLAGQGEFPFPTPGDVPAGATNEETGCSREDRGKDWLAMAQYYVAMQLYPLACDLRAMDGKAPPPFPEPPVLRCKAPELTAEEKAKILRETAEYHKTLPARLKAEGAVMEMKMRIMEMKTKIMSDSLKGNQDPN